MSNFKRIEALNLCEYIQNGLPGKEYVRFTPTIITSILQAMNTLIFSGFMYIHEAEQVNLMIEYFEANRDKFSLQLSELKCHCLLWHTK